MAVPSGFAQMDRAGALTATLVELAEATDSLTVAVERHDLAALVAANESAERLTGRVSELTADLTADDRARLDPARIGGLRERLEAAARRNAYLIERAWAIDAATMRLLMNLGRTASDGSPSAYASGASGAMYLDRQA